MIFIKKTQVSTARIWNGTTGVPTAAGRGAAGRLWWHTSSMDAPFTAQMPPPPTLALCEIIVEREPDMLKTGFEWSDTCCITKAPWRIIISHDDVREIVLWKGHRKNVIEKASHESHDRHEILIIIGFVYIQKFRQIFRVQSPDKCHASLIATANK